MTLKFQTFRYHDNFWVYYPIAVFLTVFWLFLCGALVNLFSDISNFVHFAIPCIIGNYLIVVGLAKFRYKNKGILYFDESGITYKHKNTKFLDYSSIKAVTVYYYHNNYWVENWGRLGGFFRYHHLRFMYKRSEESLDKLIIDGQKFFIKVRSNLEAKYYEEMIEMLYNEVKNISVYSTSSERLDNHDDGTIWDLKAKKQSGVE